MKSQRLCVYVPVDLDVDTPGASQTVVWILLNSHGNGHGYSCDHTDFCVDTSVIYPYGHIDLGKKTPVLTCCNVLLPSWGYRDLVWAFLGSHSQV